MGCPVRAPVSLGSPAGVRAFAAAGICLLALLSGCAKKEAGGTAPCTCASTAGVVDQALVAFLSKARAAHLRADVLEEKDPAGALSSLEGVVTGPVPKAAPEAREVLADTRARLAELRTRAGAFDDARREVEQGLALVPETSYFRGHLFEVLGFVEEKQAEARAKAGDPMGAEAARKRAVEASEKAVLIQDEVIRHALEKNGP